MDHYKALGLQSSATKEEIKAAFKKLAFQFHPDKHSQSSKAIGDNATLRFKQVSEAYGVLMDDRKRADYNIRSRVGASRSGFSTGGSSGYNYYYYYSYNYGGKGSTYDYKPRYRPGSGFSVDSMASKFESALRFLTTRAFLLNLSFAGALLGGTVIIDSSREAIWKMQNSGPMYLNQTEEIQLMKLTVKG